MYVHGERNRVRKGGKRITLRADPADVIRIDMPQWRIVDEATWKAAQAGIKERSRNVVAPGPASKYALSGVAKCGTCSGAIGVVNTKRGQKVVRAYACTYHNKRGDSVCSVAIRQPLAEVEDALADYLQRTLLTTERIERIMAKVRSVLNEESRKPKVEIDKLERELARVRAEQRKLAMAVAGAPDVPELIVELRRRADRIRAIEGDLAGASRPQTGHSKYLADMERTAREKLADLRDRLTANPDAAREVYGALFPDGLTFLPATSIVAALAPEQACLIID